MNLFQQRSAMGAEQSLPWNRWPFWRRMLKSVILLGYLGLAGVGLFALIQFVRPHTQMARWLTLQTVIVEVASVPRAQPLDITKTIDEIQKALEGKGYWQARQLLKERVSQEDWVAQTWVSFEFPHKVQVTLVPHYIWGYVFLTDQKRFRALTDQGALLLTPVVAQKVAALSHQVYFQGGIPDKPFLQRIQKEYDQVEEVISRFGLSISQVAVHPNTGTTAYLSNGVSIGQPMGWDELSLSRLEQAFHFLNQKISDINSIQFISSKKVVVSFRR